MFAKKIKTDNKTAQRARKKNKLIAFSCLFAAAFLYSCSARNSSAQNDSEPLYITEDGAQADFNGGVGGPDVSIYPPQTEFNAEKTGEQTESLYYTVYQVRQGDIIGALAENFGVSSDAIISLNGIRNTRTIQIGEYLKIPSMDGIVYTAKENDCAESIAQAYDISADDIAAVNGIDKTRTLDAGMILFLPNARLDWVTLQEINGDLFKKPIRAGKYYISSRWGWRSSPFTGARTHHGGIDMAAPTGTPVYAAMSGTVEKTAYNDSVYGNYIVIRHHSGYKTLYAHLNSIEKRITPGRSVTTDTKIGEVGNTGMSTGPHLHFSVYKYGASKNPASLWN